MPGSPITTSSARIRAAGASARPRCRPSLTRSHWRRRNSWPLDDAQQLNGTQTANSACQIKSQLIHLQTEIRRLSTERNRLRKQSLPTVSTEDLENAIFERRYVLDQLRSIHVVGRRHGSGGSLPLPVLRLLAEAFREATSEEPRQHRDRGQRFFCFVEVFA